MKDSRFSRLKAYTLNNIDKPVTVIYNNFIRENDESVHSIEESTALLKAIRRIKRSNQDETEKELLVG